MNIKLYLLVALSAVFSACENDLQLLENQSGGGINTLSISVLADQSGTKGLIESGYLPDQSKIGVSVTNSTGGAYDGTTYHNIPYTASGTGAGQSWSGSTIPLSMNQGTCYAYYPYNAGVTDIAAVPVSTSGQDDYMYATSVTVNAEAKNATLNMNHALSAVRFLLKRGSYAGTGLVSAVSVTSAGVGTSGQLNAKTGGLTGVFGKGSAIGVNTSITLSDVEQSADVIVVPTETAADLTLSVTVDGKAYSTVISSATIVQSKCHKYTLTVNQGELALSSVKVGDWGYDESGAPTITAGGYTVTFAGDYEDISFSNSVVGSVVTIRACGMTNGSRPKAVTASSGTLTQSLDGYIRTITLTNITSDVTLIFSGTIVPSYWEGLMDGIYAISSSYEAVAVTHATNDCIGVALIDSDTGQKLMIEKYENANNTESTNVYTKAAQTKGSSETSTFSWGGYGNTSGTFASTQVGAGSTKLYGHLSLDGTGLNTDPSTWAASGGALSDFAGNSNSQIIKNILDNGTQTSSTNAPMAYLMNAFNDASCSATVNQGYKDWYIPSCGQLGLIWLNVTEINNVLSKIGGTQFTAEKYWSSTETNANGAWNVDLGSGFVDNIYTTKSYGLRLRLVRDLY